LAAFPPRSDRKASVRHLLSDLRPGQVPPADADLRAIEAVAGVQLSFLDGQAAIRIEGLDGVGREIARRCVNRMLKRSISGPAR